MQNTKNLTEKELSTAEETEFSQAKLIKFTFTWGRRGADFECVEILDTKEEYEMLEKAIKENPTIYYGEIGGKHSEVMPQFKHIEREVLCEDPEFLKLAGQVYGGSVGNFQVMEYLMRPRCSEESPWYIDPDDLDPDIPEEAKLIEELAAETLEYYKSYYGDPDEDDEEED